MDRVTIIENPLRCTVETPERIDNELSKPREIIISILIGNDKVDEFTIRTSHLFFFKGLWIQFNVIRKKVQRDFGIRF